jgi:hypothetical protein
MWEPGELNIYLQVLDDFVKKPNENPSVGLVLRWSNLGSEFVSKFFRGR